VPPERDDEADTAGIVHAETAGGRRSSSSSSTVRSIPQG
jgi:hypothetical protein